MIEITLKIGGQPLIVELDQAALVAAVAAALPAPTEPWPEHMGIERAAAYLDITPEALRKLVQRRKVPFSQEGPKCRLSFERGLLDEWMQTFRRGGDA